MKSILRQTIVAVFAAVGLAECGSGDTATSNHTPSEQQSSGETGGLSGKIAPALAPPAALVVLEPAMPMELPVKAEPAIMDQSGYQFLPGFLLAQAGQNVQFRNSEDVLHNVRVAEASTH